MTDVRTLFRWVGAAITAVTALLAFAFGLSTLSNWYLALAVAVAFAFVAVGSAYVWPFVADALSKRRWIYACFVTLFAVLLTGTVVLTNFAAISGHLETESEPSKIADVCNDDSCGAISEHQETLKSWEDRRNRLLADKPWLASVSTEALRDDLVRSSQAIREESNRGGCGPKCRSLIRKYSDLSERFVAAQQFSDVSKNIAATRRKIASARKASAKPDEAAGPVLLQNAALTRFLTLQRDPTKTEQNSTDQRVSWIIAAFLTFAAIGANYLGWWGIGGGTRFGSQAPPGRSISSRITHNIQMSVGSPSLARLTLAGLSTALLGAATVAVFDQALGWQGLLFSGPIVFLLGSGAAWWVAEVYRAPPSDQC